MHFLFLPINRSALFLFVFGLASAVGAQTSDTWGAQKFKQLQEVLPTPTEVRLASGAPGPKYWQQRADYRIRVRLDEKAHVLHGDETITYKNESPHTLDYLWVQLDQNAFKTDSVRRNLAQAPDFEKFKYKALKRLLGAEKWKGGVTLKAVELEGKPARHTVVKTMMRIDLKKPLRPGDSTTLRIAWSHPVIDAKTLGGRGGYERLDDGQTIYTIAQWFPRMASYNDVDGWQHKQFWGRGEFTLDLGDYDVEITVPDDHVVAATGELRNASSVMKPEWRKRLSAAQKSDEPQYIVTPAEAAATVESDNTATWKFAAKNVRDFAFASSRRFAWDAMGVDNATGPEDGPKRVLCMSFYPPQAAPLWKRYSSQAVAHTIEVYGRMTFKYPYPVSISVNGPVGGMEYPMITFNGPRAEKDGTYYAKSGKGKSWRFTKYGLISVVIHEVGHNWFPM
ncbi:MAG: aminopeptidase, partial [Myxococcota bacterium]|nr:aminopeptidase [Myxococcota bacterium]